MATKAELKARVELDSRPFRRSLARLKGGVRKFGREVGPSFRSAGAGIATMAKQIAVAAAALAGIGVGRNFQVEQLTVQFEGLLGSIDAANQRMKELREFASNTPFQLGELAEANKLLEAVGQGGEDVLKVVGDAAAQSGNSFLELARIMQKVFVKTSSGSSLGETIDQLAERGLLATESISALKKQSKEGFSDAGSLKIIIDDLQRASGAMERLSQTGAGKISTLKDKILDSLGTITKGFSDTSKDGIQVLIDKITELSDDGTFERWGRNISITIQNVMNAYKALSDNQKTALTTMAKNAGVFLIAWKAGLVKPLIAVTAALVGRMVALLSPKSLLGGLVAVGAFLAGFGIGKAIEKHFDLSGLLLKTKAWGGAMAKMMVTIAAQIVAPFFNLGRVIGELLTTGKVKDSTLELFKKTANPKAALANLEDAASKIRKQLDEEIALINKHANPKAKGSFLEDAFANVKDEFSNAAKVTEAKARELAAKLSAALGIDAGGDAMGQFLANFQNMPDALTQLPKELAKIAPPINDAIVAIQKLKREFSLMGGGAVRSLEVGAQLAGRDAIKGAKDVAAAKNQGRNNPMQKLLGALKGDTSDKAIKLQQDQLKESKKATEAIKDITQAQQFNITGWV